MTKKYTRQELIVIAVARQIKDWDSVLLGIGLPTLAGAVAKHNHAPDARLMMESGIVGFDPLVPPAHIADSCCAQGYSYAIDLFGMFTSINFKGYLDKAVLGVGQIDKYGNLNSSYMESPDGGLERITGAGGAPEFISYAKETILTLKSGEFVNKLTYFTSPGYFGGGNERDEKGIYPKGSGPSIVITPNAMFKFDSKTKEIYLSALAPGATLEDIKSKVPWDLKVASTLEKFPVPTDDELNFLRKFSPRTCFSTKVANELVLNAAMDYFSQRDSFIKQTRTKMA
jgi:glutaconate CoA-transferase subunit B